MATLYHNPRCSKSRSTLELLQQHNIQPDIVLYLETPPSAVELERIVQQLGRPVTDMVRFGEDIAEELGLKQDDKRSVKEWCALIAAHPVLLERPIVVNNERARIGRPPESVLEIF